MNRPRKQKLVVLVPSNASTKLQYTVNMQLDTKSSNSSSLTSINTTISPTPVPADQATSAYLFTRAEFLVLTYLNSGMSIIGCPSNLIIVLSICMPYNQPNANITALLSLCIADILTCGLFQPLYIYRFNHPDQGSVFVTIQVFVGHLSMLSTLSSVVLITIDRLIAVYRPLRYIVWITSPRMYKVTAAFWIISVTISFLRVVNSWKDTMKLIVYTFSTVAFLFVDVSCFAIYRTSVNVGSKVSTSAGVMAMSRQKATKSSLLVVVFFILSWLPHLITPFIVKTDSGKYARALPWLNTFVNFNSVFNPVFYYFRFAIFRNSFRKFIRDSYNNILIRFGK